MEAKKDWTLKGIFYESCRTLDGQCGLTFGMERPTSCASFATFEIKEGKIQNVDMKGIIIVLHMDGISEQRDSIVVEEGAVYISDNATDEQRKLLEPFIMEKMAGKHFKKSLGTKSVKINISEDKGTYLITMPFGEQKTSLTIGGDGKNPIRLENSIMTCYSNIKFCIADYWKYHDYGKNLEYHNTSSQIADFTF
jgi:hypothetical protein